MGKFMRKTHPQISKQSSKHQLLNFIQKSSNQQFKTWMLYIKSTKTATFWPVVQTVFGGCWWAPKEPNSHTTVHVWFRTLTFSKILAFLYIQTAEENFLFWTYIGTLSPYLLSGLVLHPCQWDLVCIDPNAGLQTLRKSLIPWMSSTSKQLSTLLQITANRGKHFISTTCSHPVSFSLLMALERSLTHPRKPAPCFLWIFLWFQTLMVIESDFPMYLERESRLVEVQPLLCATFTFIWELHSFQ